MTEKWVRDTGLIFSLLALFLAYKGFIWGIPIAATLVLIVLFVPWLLWPLAFLWEKIAHALGFVMQRVFFGIVFFLIVTPVGLLRRLFVHDPLVLTSSASKGSAFVDSKTGLVCREHLEKPY